MTARQMGRKGGRKRWQGVSPEERARLVPRTGGGHRPRRYPPCPRYKNHAHRFTNDRCPCGYVRATDAPVRSKPTDAPAKPSPKPASVQSRPPIPPPIVIH